MSDTNFIENTGSVIETDGVSNVSGGGSSSLLMWTIVGVIVVFFIAGASLGLWFWLKKKKCNPGNPNEWDYTRRIESGGSYVCPPEYTDTGCDWIDGPELGEKQCRREARTKCDPGDRSRSEYTRRVESGGAYVCPPGYFDTGCDWKHGGDLGELQCRKPKSATTMPATPTPPTAPCNPGVGQWEYTRRTALNEVWSCPAGWIDTGCTWEHGLELGELQCRREPPKAPPPVKETTPPKAPILPVPPRPQPTSKAPPRLPPPTKAVPPPPKAVPPPKAKATPVVPKAKATPVVPKEKATPVVPKEKATPVVPKAPKKSKVPKKLKAPKKSKAPQKTAVLPQTPVVSQPLENTGEWKKTNISYFGQDRSDDNGEGFIGVDLFKLGNSNLTFNGKKVYPVAVHHDHGPEYLYKVLEIRSPGKVTPGFLGFVSDICDRKDSSCRNVNNNGIGFLVDIHKTGFEASGNRNNGNDLTTGEFRVVGTIPPKDVPKDVWLKGSWVLSKCTGRCEKSEQTWVDPKKL